MRGAAWASQLPPNQCGDFATFAGEHMNWDRIEGNWRQLKGKAKEQWGKLTDDHIDRIAGKRDQLVGRVQETYGISQDEADRQVEDWASRLDSARH
jgi:uncharacterized protein YjbJ (UPF0337 family)